MSQRYTAAVSSAASVNFPSSGAHSFVGWIYADSTTSGIAAADLLYGDNAAGGGAANSCWIGFDNTNWVFQETVTGSGSFLFSTPRTLTTWTHLALTYDGTNVRCYVNGSLVNTTAWASNSRTNFNYMDIGYGGDFTAQDVMAFSVTLTAAQVLETMRLAPPAGVSAYGWWKLLNAAPTTDSSGNSHTLSNGGDANGSQILLAGSGTVQVASAGTTTSGALLGTATVGVSGSGLASVAAALSGTALARAAASATLTAGAALAGTALARVAAAGTVTAAVSLVGSGLVGVSASGTLQGVAPPVTVLANRSRFSRRNAVAMSRRSPR